MTIASTTSKVPYNGSGSVGPFSITFPFIKNADIVATKVSTTGVETTLTLTTDYTLTGAGEASGGALTLVSALASGEKIIIKRSPAQVQETEYTEGSDFPAASHEAALDLLTMQVQDLQEQLDRAVLVDISSSTSPADLLDELETDVAAAAASASAASTSAGTATTQAGVATTQAGLAAGSAGDASDSADLAQEWATNPEDDAVTGYPGEYSALHWAAKAAEAASGGAFKVSADDTTPGYLESKLTLISNSGLAMATTSPAGDEVRTLGVDLTSNSGLSISATGLSVDLDTDPGLVLGLGGLKVLLAASGSGLSTSATGLAVDLASNAGLQVAATGLEVKVKTAGGITKDADGLSVASSGGEWSYVPGSKQTASASASLEFTGLDGTVYDYKFILRKIDPATDNAYITALIGYGAGPTYMTQNYSFALNSLDSSATAATYVGYTGQSSARLSPPVPDASANKVYMTVEAVADGDDNVCLNVVGDVHYVQTNPKTLAFSGFADSYTSGFTAIKFLANTGNITSGTVEIYRRVKN